MERRTRQREAICAAFTATARPLSAPQVLQAARVRARGLGLATVYRALKGLLKEGWLVEVQMPSGAPRYECAGKSHHHHFHCRGCDRLYEIPACPRDIRRLAPRGSTLEGHHLVLYGLCPKCTQAG